MSGYAQQANIEIWAYCLMPNHVHLVIVPNQLFDVTVSTITETLPGITGPSENDKIIYNSYMQRFSRKRLCLYFTLLVALIPLQVVAASFPGAPETQDNLFQELTLLIEDGALSTDFGLTQPSDQCKAEASCFCYNCSSGQCTNCATLLSPSIQISLLPVTRQKMRWSDEGPARLLFDSLFRPPKI